MCRANNKSRKSKNAKFYNVNNNYCALECQPLIVQLHILPNWMKFIAYVQTIKKDVVENKHVMLKNLYW